jgi:hypothetical protein
MRNAPIVSRGAAAKLTYLLGSGCRIRYADRAKGSRSKFSADPSDRRAGQC